MFSPFFLPLIEHGRMVASPCDTSPCRSPRGFITQSAFHPPPSLSSPPLSVWFANNTPKRRRLTDTQTCYRSQVWSKKQISSRFDPLSYPKVELLAVSLQETEWECDRTCPCPPPLHSAVCSPLRPSGVEKSPQYSWDGARVALVMSSATRHKDVVYYRPRREHGVLFPPIERFIDFLYFSILQSEIYI